MSNTNSLTFITNNIKDMQNNAIICRKVLPK